MSEELYLSVRDLFSEKILRNCILFFTLFIFTITQEWDNIILFIFPFITFSFSIIFQIINDNKWRISIRSDILNYNPLGSEKIHSNRFFFSSLLLLIFLFWIGAESYYHPQLINNYSLFFQILYIFTYSFTFFWIFLDIWNYSHIIITPLKEYKNLDEIKQNITQFTHIIDIKFIKLISYLSLTVFLVLNLLNILFSFLTLNSIISGIKLNLPGNSLELSQGLLLNYLLFLSLLISPILTIILFFIIYKQINELDPNQIEDILNNCSEETKNLILENFRILNIKFKKKKNIK